MKLVFTPFSALGRRLLALVVAWATPAFAQPSVKPTGQQIPNHTAAIATNDAPAVVEEDVRRIDEQYRRLERIAVAGPLAQLALRSVVPKEYSVPSDAVSAEQSDVEAATLSGQRGRQILRIRFGDMESVVLVLDDEGRLLSKLYLEDRCDLLLRDVVGDEEDEVILDRVVGRGVSIRPRFWETYRVDERGKLRLVHSFPKAFSVGAKNAWYGLWNTFNFDARGSLRVTTAVADCDRDTSYPCWKEFIAKTGDIHSFQYDEKRRRFVASKTARR
jgi:hypothetical protein